MFASERAPTRFKPDFPSGNPVFLRINGMKKINWRLLYKLGAVYQKKVTNSF